MSDIKAIDLICLHGCAVKDDRGVHIATLYEDDGVVEVRTTPACSVGTYFSVLTYLRELGFEVK